MHQYVLLDGFALFRRLDQDRLQRWLIDRSALGNRSVRLLVYSGLAGAGAGLGAWAALAWRRSAARRRNSSMLSAMLATGETEDASQHTA